MVYLTSPKWSCGGYCHHLCMLSVCYFFHISIFFLENLGLIGSKLGRNIFLLEVPQHCIWFFWVPFRKPTLLLGPVILSSWLIFQISNQKPQVWCTGTCFTQKIYAPSSSLLQGKHLPFSTSPLRLNIFHLFVINWTRIVSERGLLKISVNEMDTATSGLRWIFHMHSEFSRPAMCNNATWSSLLKCKVSL